MDLRCRLVGLKKETGLWRERSVLREDCPITLSFFREKSIARETSIYLSVSLSLCLSVLSVTEHKAQK